MDHKFFYSPEGPDKYWKSILHRKNTPPYKPNPLRYKYLLSNEYETVSNLTAKCESPCKSDCESPLPGFGRVRQNPLASFPASRVNKEFENF